MCVSSPYGREINKTSTISKVLYFWMKINRHTW